MSWRHPSASVSGRIPIYVYDPDDRLAERVNRGMVSLTEALEESDERMLRRLVENHRAYTDSERAAELLDDWEAALDDFVRVFPDAYADVIAEGTGADVREDPPRPAESVPEGGRDAAGQVSGDD